MSTLNGASVLDLDLTIPPAGAILGSGHLTSGGAIAAGPAVLVVGDLSCRGYVLPGRGGVDGPDRPSFVFAIGYGWRRRLPAPGGAYTSPSDVRLSTVLRDLAGLATVVRGDAATAETYDAAKLTEKGLGKRYGWDAGTRAWTVLADLVKRQAIPMWRVDPETGRTVFAAWPTLPAADAFGVVSSRRLANGARHVALDGAVRAWLPGATIEDVAIRRLVLHESGGELSAEVYDS